MIENIKIIIKYFRIKKYLMNELGYSNKSAIRVIDKIRKMKPEIKRAFVVWFTKGETPKEPLCGVDYDKLLTYRDLNHVSAFLAIDWYARNPEDAFNALSAPQKDVGREPACASEDEINRLLDKYSIKHVEPTENTDDIVS